MASKASMLKKSANKASSGLFAGMTPLNKESGLSKSTIAEKEEKKKELTEEKDNQKESEIEKESQVEVETVEKELSEENTVSTEQEHNSAASEITEADKTVETSEQAPELTTEPVAAQNQTVNAGIESNFSNIQNQATVVEQNAKENIVEQPSITHEQQRVISEEQYVLHEQQTPVYGARTVVQEQHQRAYEQQPYMQEPQRYVNEPQRVVPEQHLTSETPLQSNRQSYVQNPATQVPTFQQTTQMPMYQQAPVNYQQPVMTQQVMPAYAEPQKPARQPKQDKSRYEKDKFLLLDIRGYRDYVEHMAKASNMSATKYIRSLIEKDMSVNWDIYQAHKQLEEAFKERR